MARLGQTQGFESPRYRYAQTVYNRIVMECGSAYKVLPCVD